MKNLKFAVMGIALVGQTSFAYAINNAPADTDTVKLRVSCTEGGIAIPNCFNSMVMVDSWLRNVRQVENSKPTLIDVGPGEFAGWECRSSNITLRGNGRENTKFVDIGTTYGSDYQGNAMRINEGCTNLSVHDLSLVSVDAVVVENLASVTSWTNVALSSATYAWVESSAGACPASRGKHSWFNSTIKTTSMGFVSWAYSAKCSESWFWGSEIISESPSNTAGSFAIYADRAEVHLYGSNARLVLSEQVAASAFRTDVSGTTRGHFLLGATGGSEIHVHGTGLDIIHKGTGTATGLYADASSHFHANESGYNIHVPVSSTGKVRRLAGAGPIQAPYLWGESTVPPLSTSVNGVQTLISRSGADRYIETDCPLNDHCGNLPVSATLSEKFPHEMIYRSECGGVTSTTGPWFDTITRACRK